MTDLLPDIPNILPTGSVETLESDTQRIVEFLRRLREDYEEFKSRGDMDYKIQHAINVIQSTYGDTVSVDAKNKDLRKFGRNPQVGNTGRVSIWYTGQDNANETYVADNVNSIDTISSSSGSDGLIVTVEGHTMSGGNRAFVTQQATLNGQNKVTLSTPLNRCSRVFNSSSTSLIGEVYVYEDTAISAGKPSDTTKIHLTVPAGNNQSQKASTSLSSTDYWIVTGFGAGYLEKTGSNVANVEIEVRQSNNVFRPISRPIVLRTGTTESLQFNPYLIIPPNSDIRITAISSGSGQEIEADMQGYLAAII